MLSTTQPISEFAQGDLAESFLEANLDALALSSSTRNAVRQASSRGRVRHLSDSTPVIVADDRVLGRPPLDADVREAAHQVEATGGSLAVFGLGLGHTVRAIRALTDAPIVVYEPDARVLRTALEYGPSDLGGVTIVCDTGELVNNWTHLAKNGPHATVVGTQGYIDHFAREYHSFREAVHELISRISSNALTHHVRAQDWVRDILQNIEVLVDSPTFLALRDQFEGVPAFVVGAGPSLDKNVHLLHDAVRKGLVIAVNSSGKGLAKAGVEPQVLACIESLDLSHLLLDLPFIDRVVRAFSLTGHPNTLRAGNGPLLPIFEGLHETNKPLAELTGYQGLPIGGSVSTAAVSLAYRLGCNPIVMVGHDLAYTDGQTYASGTPFEKSRARVSSDGQWVELDWDQVKLDAQARGNFEIAKREPLHLVKAWGGAGTVTSSASFNAVRAFLETAATIFPNERPGLKLINASEGGCRIEGFEESALASVLDGLPSRDITPTKIVEMATQASRPLDRSQMMGWVETQIRLNETVRRAARRTRRLAECCAKLINGNDQSRARQGIDLLETAERALRVAVAEAPFVNAWAHADIDDVMSTNCSGNDARQRAADGTQQEAALAATVERSARELKEEFAQLRSRLAHRAST